MNWMYVFIGGGLGSLARHAIFESNNRFATSFPPFISTLFVNILGCFFIGLLFAYMAIKNSTESFRLFWMVGFLGGLTTFSTLGLDIFQMIQKKSIFYASTYFLIHGTICILFVYLGYWTYSQR